MRLYTALLLVSASGAFGQPSSTNSSTIATATFSALSTASRIETASAIKSTTSSTIVTTSSALPAVSSIDTTRAGRIRSEISTTTSSASNIASCAFDLQNAILGRGTSFYPPSNGASISSSTEASSSALDWHQAPLLPVPAPVLAFFDVASASFEAQICTLRAASVGTGLHRIAVTNVTSLSNQRKRARNSPSSFVVLADSEVVLAEPITINFSNLEISTNPITPKDSYDSKFHLSCNGVNIDIVIINRAAVENHQGATSTRMSSTIICTPTDTATSTTSLAESVTRTVTTQKNVVTTFTTINTGAVSVATETDDPTSYGYDCFLRSNGSSASGAQAESQSPDAPAAAGFGVMANHSNAHGSNAASFAVSANHSNAHGSNAGGAAAAAAGFAVLANHSNAHGSNAAGSAPAAGGSAVIANHPNAHGSWQGYWHNWHNSRDYYGGADKQAVSVLSLLAIFIALL